MGVTGHPMVLDQLGLYQLIGFPEFAHALPPGCEDLLPMAEETRKKVLDVAMGRVCAGCSSVRTVMQPFQNALGLRLAAIQQETPSVLDPLKTLILDKRNYRIRPVVVYYKGEQGQALKLTL